MKFLVTGATGFVGSHLLQLLHEKGLRTVCPVRNPASLRHLTGISTQVIPFDNLEKQILAEGPFDYVIHAAAATRALNYQQYYQANVELSNRLLRVFIDEPFKKKLKRFVFISSQAVVGPSNRAGIPLTEIAPPAPISFYGKSKWEAEQAVQAVSSQIPVTILRPSTVFGPRDVDILGVFKSLRWRIAPYIAGPDRYLSIVYVEDLVRGILAATLSNKSLGNTYFLTNPEPVLWRDFVFQIASVSGYTAIPLAVPIPVIRFVACLGDFTSRLTGTPLLMRRDKFLEMVQTAWVCSPDKAWADFGWRASTPLPEAIAKTVSWYRHHGWL